MLIAIEGCCHGELDKIYETVQHAEEQNQKKIDLLLICGDFQAVRNRSDFSSLAVPTKYQKLNTFYKYYSGEKVAPVLTIFIGGNHEASNYLQELPYGGWVAPKIYYMGYAGVVNFGGLRIGGLSGIFKSQDYHKGHFEHPPYNESTKRSVYHVRNLEVFRLKQIRQPLDIFMSHDWPRGIYDYGNIDKLLRKKKFFADEVSAGTLGSPAAEELLHALKPDYWFSAHLHVKFPAIVEFELDGNTTKATKFLALDKCLPGRQFLQILEINPGKEESKELRLDAEWLTILHSTNHLLSVSRGNVYMPGIGSNERYDFSATKEELEDLSKDFGGNFVLPENFVQTAAPHDGCSGKTSKQSVSIYLNSQTALLCEMVGLSDPLTLFRGLPLVQANTSDSLLDNSLENSDFVNSTLASTGSFNPEEISLDDCENVDGSDEEDGIPSQNLHSISSPNNQDEVVLNKCGNDIPEKDEMQTERPTVSLEQKSEKCSKETEKSSNSLETVVRTLPETDRVGEKDPDLLSTPIHKSTPKVFKRRNYAIYASTENDETT